MNAQSGVCTPAGGLVTGEPPTLSPLCPGNDTGERRGRSAVGLAPSGVPGGGGVGGGGRWLTCLAGGEAGPQSAVSRPAGVLVLLSLDYLTSVFYFIPKAALAAVIITAVAPLVDTTIVGTLWRVKSA